MITHYCSFRAIETGKLEDGWHRKTVKRAKNQTKEELTKILEDELGYLEVRALTFEYERVGYS